jgi:peroxidase
MAGPRLLGVFFGVLVVLSDSVSSQLVPLNSLMPIIAPTAPLVDVQTKFPQLSSYTVNNAVASAQNAPLPPSAAPAPTASPAGLSAMFGGSGPPPAVQHQASVMEGVSRSISGSLGLANQDIPVAMWQTMVNQMQSNCTVPAEIAQVPLNNPFGQGAQSPCLGSKYRTVDGYCNNIAYPNRGQASTIFVRLQNPDYADGISTPRVAISGNPLPSARLVSTTLVGLLVRLAPPWTHLLMQFGQFLDHDLTRTPQTVISGTCCTDASSGASSYPSAAVDPQCFPIQIPSTDPFYSQFAQGCMEFKRSIPGTRPGCALGPRIQINQVSSFIDGNQIYGSTSAQEIALRQMQNGLLSVTVPYASNPKYSLLPADPTNTACIDGTSTSPCFNAGDNRANIQIGLQAITTTFVRHHNNIAQQLQLINPGWNDETLYQETRAIVAAQLQHITYNEWLPVLLGFATTGANGAANSTDALIVAQLQQALQPLQSGRFNGYDITVNPQIGIEFATAALRVGHTMVVGTFDRMNSNLQVQGTETVRNTFFQCSHMYQNNAADQMMIGLAQDKGKIVENNVAADLSEFLFLNPGASFGMDLVSLNVQRGRDHGLPGYMTFRRLCGLPSATSFQQMQNLSILPAQVITLMATIYESVEDIDLFVAGISEARLTGAIIGPTFACIIGEQFARLRRSDRFWYENGFPVPSTFSDAQLAEIRKTSFASILCDSTPLMNQTQALVFQTVSATNPVVPCGTLPTLNLQAWSASNPAPPPPTPAPPPSGPAPPPSGPAPPPSGPAPPPPPPPPAPAPPG